MIRDGSPELWTVTHPSTRSFLGIGLADESATSVLLVESPTATITVLLAVAFALADNEQMTEPNALVQTLLQQLDVMAISRRQLASAIGISPSTLTGWSRGANPRSLPLCAAGLEAGWRLELTPLDPDFPGLSQPARPDPPSPEDWWASHSALARPVCRVTAEYLLSLVGAELHWTRAVIQGVSRTYHNNVSRTWDRIERGPRGSSGITIASLQEAAEDRRFRLVWVDSTALWRVRPWQLPGAPERPPRIRSRVSGSFRF